MTAQSYAIQKKYGKRAVDLVYDVLYEAAEPLTPLSVYKVLCEANTIVNLSTVHTALCLLKKKGIVKTDSLRNGKYSMAWENVAQAKSKLTPKIKKAEAPVEVPSEAEYRYICEHTDGQVSVFPASELLTLANEEFFKDGDRLVHVKVLCMKTARLKTIVETRFVPDGED